MFVFSFSMDCFTTVNLLCLEHGSCSLEDHVDEFLDLVHLTTFPDDYLNTTTCAQLSGECPRGSFADYVEWVLVSCGSAFSVEDVTSSTPLQTQSPANHHPAAQSIRQSPLQTESQSSPQTKSHCQKEWRSWGSPRRQSLIDLLTRCVSQQ